MKYRFTAVLHLEVEGNNLSEAIAAARQRAERIEATGSAAGSRFVRKGEAIRVQLEGEHR